MISRRLFNLLVLCLVTALVNPLIAAPTAPQNTNWLSYNNNINGQRYVPLAEINTANAADLGEVCNLRVEDIGGFQTSLLHIDGVLYFTTASDTLAVD